MGPPRWLVLGTGSRSAAKIYSDHGFCGLNGGLDTGAKGYNPDDLGEWIMVRDATRAEHYDINSGNVPFNSTQYASVATSAEHIVVEPLQRKHWGAATLLLNMTAGSVKMRAFGVDDGLNAELRLAQAFRDCEPVTVAIHSDSRRVLGIAFSDATTGLEVYTVGATCVGAVLVGGIPSRMADVDGAERRSFWEKGFLVFPGLLSAEAPEICKQMDALLESKQDAGTANWNAVDSGGAEHVLAVDEAGVPTPGRILKIQAAALGSPAVLEVLGSHKIRQKVEALYGHLGQEVPQHVDVFGTKFFPMWPGGVSVSWHQDCHYFGTASPRIISCGVYLQDTDSENGCLQVVPGSHTRGVLPHAPGTGEHAQGEWVSLEKDASVLDVKVPAGSVVLFNAMLLHAARKNTHRTRSRYSMFGHFVPATLGFEWRGTDFSHGVYRDRHSVY